MKSRMHQRGVAVITALLLTTLAITIVASLFWQQQVQVRSIENQRLQLQKQWVLRGALDYAKLILKEDAEHSRVDHLGEPWAVPLADTRLDQYVDNGRADVDTSDASLSGSITDAQARYNLSNLCVNGAVNPRELAAFQRLLVNLRINPELAQVTANAMLETQRKPIDPNHPVPIETPPVGPRQTPILRVEDLLAVPGFSTEIINKLRDYLIVLPRPTPININTAPVEVIAAKVDTLSVADAASLVSSRERAYFLDNSDVTQRIPGKPLNLSTEDVAVTTSYFLVNGKVRLNRASLQIQALIERNVGAKPKIIWIREE